MKEGLVFIMFMLLFGINGANATGKKYQELTLSKWERATMAADELNNGAALFQYISNYLQDSGYSSCMKSVAKGIAEYQADTRNDTEKQFKLAKILFSASILVKKKKPILDRKKFDMGVGVILKYLERHPLSSKESKFSAVGNTAPVVKGKCDYIIERCISIYNGASMSRSIYRSHGKLTERNFASSGLKNFLSKTAMSPDELLKEILMQ